MPLMIAKLYNDGQWMFDGVGTSLCKLEIVTWGVSTVVSMLSMVTIAVDRFHAILFAMKSPLICRKTCPLVIFTLWITSTVLQPFAIYGHRVVREDKGIYCDSYTEKAKRIHYLSLIVLSAVSAIVLPILYSSIIIFLHKQKRSIHMASEVVSVEQEKIEKLLACL